MIPIQPGLMSPPLSSYEVQNIDYFRNVCIDNFSGVFRDDMWERNILQYMEAHPSLRYAAIAVAAVHRTLAFPELSSSLGQLVSCHQEAFASYAKAVRILASSLVDDHASRELACIASVLFATFEVLRGNDQGSMLHLEAAFGILKTP